MHDDVTPHQVMRETGRWFPAAVVVKVAVIALGLIATVICWQAGWWFAAHDATRQAQVIQNGYSNQSTLRSQVTAKLADVTQITAQIAAAKGSPDEVAALKDQRAAIAAIACSDAAQVTGTPLPAQQARWVSANCSDGSVSPGSPFYVTGAP